MVTLAALLWNVGGGHPPPIIIPMVGAMLWTCSQRWSSLG